MRARDKEKKIQRTDIHAFVVAAETRAAIVQALEDRRLAKTHPVFFEGGIAAATLHYQTSASPDLLIIETGEPAEILFPLLDQLSQVCRTETNLMLLGAQNDVHLYRTLTKQGVREYLPLPLAPQHLLDAVLAIFADPAELRQGRLVSFIGASGGVGSTTLANNVAWCLGQIYGAEATLVDLDLAFGTVAIDFNLESPEDAAQALAQADRLDDQVLARIVGKYSDTLGLLTAPGDCTGTADIDPSALDQMLRVLRRNASWVIADLPHYWGGWVRQVIEESDDIVLTAVPTLASLRNAKSVVDALNPKRKNDAPVRVVLNQLGRNPKTDIPLKDFEHALGCGLTASLPHDPAIFAPAANAGTMIGESNRAKSVIEPLNALAALVSRRNIATRAPAPRKPGLFERLLPGKIAARARA